MLRFCNKKNYEFLKKTENFEKNEIFQKKKCPRVLVFSKKSEIFEFFRKFPKKSKKVENMYLDSLIKKTEDFSKKVKFLEKIRLFRKKSGYVSLRFPEN